MFKYFYVTKNYLAEYFAYRLNFLLWRVRVIVSVLISYFLWSAIYGNRKQIFNYTKNQMLTYIVLLTFINGIVLATQTQRIAEEINQGTLSNFLIRPMDYFAFNLFRDLADKSINTFFAVIEIVLIILLLKPGFIVQSDPIFLILFIFSLFLSVILYFIISILISFIGFWSREYWAPRFIFFIIIAFMAGTYFPLDIVPQPVYSLIEFLPFTYLVFFPLKIYLGNILLSQILKGFLITLFWIFFLYLFARLVWKKGLKIYTAEGK